MNISNYLNMITFIPWILLFLVSSLINLTNKNYQKFDIKYLKKNFFKIFRLDTLFLIIVFFYFACFNKEFVLKYLFAAICMYLFVNSFYENKLVINKKILKENLLNIILILLFMLIPFIIYFINKNLELTYKIMLLYHFLDYIITVIIKNINRLIRKIFNLRKCR